MIPKAPSKLVSISDVQIKRNIDHHETLAVNLATTVDVLLLVNQEGMTLQELSGFEAARRLTNSALEDSAHEKSLVGSHNGAHEQCRLNACIDCNNNDGCQRLRDRSHGSDMRWEWYCPLLDVCAPYPL